MYELTQEGERTWVIHCPSNMGIVETEGGVCLIDSGNNKEAGKKVKKILDAHGWTLKMILNTHSNADHIGGNQYLQEQYHCPAYAPKQELSFLWNPILEPSFLFGGYPCWELRSRFLMAQPSEAQPLTEDILPDGLRMFSLPGHFFEMAGFRTADDVVFLADCFVGEDTLEKYHISFLYDVRAYLKTLDEVEQMDAAVFVPAHRAPSKEIQAPVEANRRKVAEIMDRILEACAAPVEFGTLLKAVFDQYRLTMDFSQYALVGSTVRSYLSYLHDEGKVQAEFQDNRLLWRKVLPGESIPKSKEAAKTSK